MTALSASASPPAANRRAVGIWLLVVAAIIVGMVTLGGLTRLTGSGLSITQWHPVTGVIPPLGHRAWVDEFAKYKDIPQYRLENRGMTLGEFKQIFWWEWTHRLLGRLLGVVFLLPFLWFAWAGAIAKRDWPRMVAIFALGALQGFIGWWMVKSGLEVRVSVSQYRLAIHLGTAILLLGVILWVALEYLRPPGATRPRAAKPAFAFVALVYLQMLLGALVAGLHAGLLYNTWPSMNGRFGPESPFYASPWWINFFENPGLAQFDHRIGAYIVGLSAIGLWVWSRRLPFARFARRAADAVLAVTLVQIALGITTLLLVVPLPLAAAHQVTAALLLCCAVWQAYEWRYAAASP